MKYWITGDQHFNDSEIIGFCNEPFKNVEEKNLIQIRKWNERVKKDDIVIHNGDFSHKTKNIKTAKYWESQLNGKIIHIDGNHNNNNGCKSIIQNMVISLGGYNINIVHDPEFCDINYDINLTSHVHTAWRIKRFKQGYSFTDCINVGVDVWGFKPISINEILKRYVRWKRKYDKE